MNKAIGNFIIGAFWDFVSCVVDGFIFYSFYNWFVKDSFNLPSVSFVSMVGIGVFFSYINMSIGDAMMAQKTDKQTISVAKWAMRIMAANILIIGYIVHLVDTAL